MLMASPRRSSGARSLTAATAATKKNASPTPYADRTRTNAGSDVAKKCATNAATVTAPPSSSSGRRPNRSDAHPTTGRNSSAAIENAPIPTPTPSPEAASGPFANRVATGSTIPPAVKNASADTNSAMNVGVMSGGRGAPRWAAHRSAPAIASSRRSAAA